MMATEKRIDEIFEIKEYDYDGKISIQQISQIRVENLSFSYKDKKIIDGLSFRMNTGCITAFRGVSGCGKSTLLKLLSRVIPVKDNMIFINSQDINTIDRSSLWKNIGYVSQHAHVVKGTIIKNILDGEQFCQERFQEVVATSTLNDTLHNFKDGFEQVIDENTVSTGEKQKIALARVLYKKPDFLCLDEVVSAMDPLSQTKVLENLVDYVKNHNILCAYVSHVTEEKECPEIEEVWL
jgi:ABC-type multidrug transport system fused ATPase/permease subunit